MVKRGNRGVTTAMPNLRFTSSLRNFKFSSQIIYLVCLKFCYFDLPMII